MQRRSGPHRTWLHEHDNDDVRPPGRGDGADEGGRDDAGVRQVQAVRLQAAGDERVPPGGVGRLRAEVLGQARLACLVLGWSFGGAASDGCFRETTLAWRSVELLPVQLSGLGGFLPSLVIHRENLFCVAVAVGCARRLDICGRYKSLCEATV